MSAIVALLQACALKAGTGLPAQQESLPACYSLTRGNWDEVPEPVLQSLPGVSLRLLRTPAATKHIINSGPPLPSRAWRAELTGESESALWWVDEAGTLVVHTGGFAGVVLYLRPSSSDELTGEVVAFTDFLRVDAAGKLTQPLSRAPLAVHRQPC
jgi:hypothetical protein